MKDNNEHKDDGHVNRDGITQGSGYGDTQAKAVDAEAAAMPETDYDKALKEKLLTDDSNKPQPILPNAESDHAEK